MSLLKLFFRKNLTCQEEVIRRAAEMGGGCIFGEGEPSVAMMHMVRNQRYRCRHPSIEQHWGQKLSCILCILCDRYDDPFATTVIIGWVDRRKGLVRHEVVLRRFFDFNL